MRSRQISSGWLAWLTMVGTLAFSSVNVEAAPVISSLSPNSATAGGPQFTLTVNGTGFGGLLITSTDAGAGRQQHATDCHNHCCRYRRGRNRAGHCVKRRAGR